MVLNLSKPAIRSKVRINSDPKALNQQIVKEATSTTPDALYVERFIFLGDWLWKESSAEKPSWFFVFFSVSQLELLEVSKKAQLTPFSCMEREISPPALPACLVEWGLMMDCLSVLCFCLCGPS